MKLSLRRCELGFTLAEIMVSLGIGILLLAALITSAVALRKSFSAADHFFSTHVQQIRIIDFLSRDVKRSTVVTTSSANQTVTCTVPNYIVNSGDPDVGVYDQAAQTYPVGMRRTPIINVTPNGAVVHYGVRTPAGLVVYNGVITGSKPVTQVQYAVNNNAIERRETPCTANSSDAITSTGTTVVTTIASSTDQLVPLTLDVELANTEYLDTSVTFLTTFNFNPPADPNPSATPNPTLQMKRDGTAIFARSYLRNKRRG